MAHNLQCLAIFLFIGSFVACAGPTVSPNTTFSDAENERASDSVDNAETVTSRSVGSYSAPGTGEGKNNSLIEEIAEEMTISSAAENITPSPSGQDLRIGGFVGNKAPEFQGINNWINSEPLTMKELRGKVVLVDFWTLGCHNCIATMPYLKDWYAKYAGVGFVIVGVHSPEFEYEHDTDNVVNSTVRFGLEYPVAQDNDFATWNSYSNRYWPAEYLIDQHGIVRYRHFGEGAYEETENQIRDLLTETGVKLSPAY